MEAEIEKLKKRRTKRLRLIRREPLMRTQICKELLKNPKKPRRKKSGQDLLQLSCKEKESLERKRNLRKLEVMILILEEAFKIKIRPDMMLTI